MKCSNCGMELDENKKFCINCGTKLTTEEVPKTEVKSVSSANSKSIEKAVRKMSLTEQPPKDKFRWLYSILVIILTSTLGVAFKLLSIFALSMAILRYIRTKKKGFGKVINIALITWASFVFLISLIPVDDSSNNVAETIVETTQDATNLVATEESETEFESKEESTEEPTFSVANQSEVFETIDELILMPTEYFIKDSNSKYLEESDIVGLSSNELQAAINEIYARYGCIFKSDEWNSIFDTLDWYIPQVTISDFDTSVFNDFEVKNIEFLTEKQETISASNLETQWIYGEYEKNSNLVYANLEYGFYTDSGEEYVSLNGKSKDGSIEETFLGTIVHSNDGRFIAEDDNERIVEGFYNGLHSIELYGIDPALFSGLNFTGTYRKTSEYDVYVEEAREELSETIATTDYSDNQTLSVMDETYTMFSVIYPEKFSTERNELLNFIKPLDTMSVERDEMFAISDPKFISVKRNLDGSYTRTLSDVTEHYYGTLNSNNQPDGIGFFLGGMNDMEHDNVNGFVSVPKFVGHFKNGKIDGYGIKISPLGIREEGYFNSDMELDGEGIKYHDRDFSLPVYQQFKLLITEELKESLPSEGMCLNFPILQSSVEYEGTFADGKINGNGKAYYDVYQTGHTYGESAVLKAGTGPYGPLWYEGQFKKGQKEGKGKLYFFSNKLYYDGEFKNNVFHGKGTLFEEDGTLIHNGQFRNGDIK